MHSEDESCKNLNQKHDHNNEKDIDLRHILEARQTERQIVQEHFPISLE